MKKQPSKYYNILTDEGATEATILMYGYIGTWYEYDPEVGYKQTGVRDIEFVQELNRLASKYKTIHVRINSPGGEVFHGSAIVTAIRDCPAEVHTWIDGVAASMAGIIWMAGKKRHMAKNAMLMIHSASGYCFGNAADMRELADTIDAFDQSLITSAADSLGTSEDEMKSKYFDGKDHWLTYNDVSGNGWLTVAGEEYTGEGKLPDNITNMKYRDLVAYFEQEENRPALPTEQTIAQWIRSAWEKLAAKQQSPVINNAKDMTLDEFKKSMTDGTLKAEDVKAFLDSQTPAPAPAAPAEDPIVADLRAQLAAQQDSITKLTNQVEQLGQKPGEGKSTPPPPAAGLPTPDGLPVAAAELKAFNDTMAEAANTAYNPFKKAHAV